MKRFSKSKEYNYQFLHFNWKRLHCNGNFERVKDLYTAVILRTS